METIFSKNNNNVKFVRSLNEKKFRVKNNAFYLEGIKVVEDRGSDKYFSTINSCDVFVPRNPGENDAEYFSRVNAKGRHYKQSYIIKKV